MLCVQPNEARMVGWGGAVLRAQGHISFPLPALLSRGETEELGGRGRLTKSKERDPGRDPRLTEGLTVCLRFKLEAPGPDFMSLPSGTKSEIHSLAPARTRFHAALNKRDKLE